VIRKTKSRPRNNMTWVLLDLYEATGDKIYLEKADKTTGCNLHLLYNILRYDGLIKNQGLNVRH